MPTRSARLSRATIQGHRGSPPNYFNTAALAARYGRARPFFHGEVARRLRSFAGVQRFARVLDVGCGSGQSAVALAEIADEVIAIDPSPSMLAAAQRVSNVQYLLGAAERLDFATAHFDLVSVGSALHWFDQERFYAECHNVLSRDGLLAIYNDHFTAHMQGLLGGQQAGTGVAADPAACKRWMRTRFAKRYRSPRRGMRDMDEQRAAECGFQVVQRGSFSHLVPFSRSEFIAYLLTRSNTLACVAEGRESESEIVEWLDGELAGIVPDRTRGMFIFKCNHWVLRR